MALTKITGDGYGAGTITTADNTVQLTLKSTDADANNGPILDLIRDSGSPADGDEVGIIRFKFDDDAGEVNTAARFTAKINDASNGTEDGELEIVTLINGSSRSRIEMLPTETVINEDSQDVDFRVESDGNANMLFVDGGNNAVGIGSAPNTTFGSLLYTQGTPAANKPIISGYSQGNSNNAGFALLNDAGNRGIWTTGSTMRFTRTYEGNSTADLNIDASGKIFMGTATSADGFLQVKANNQSDVLLMLADTSGSGGAAIRFKVNGTAVGSITNNASSTAYNESSDYRLKENVEYTWDATSRLKQLKPARFNFIIDPDTTVDGFLAHEVSSIVPQSITGEKDAVDDNGDAVYQQIDQSKLVPLLVKTIQELEARITALESA